MFELGANHPGNLFVSQMILLRNELTLFEAAKPGDLAFRKLTSSSFDLFNRFLECRRIVRVAVEQFDHFTISDRLARSAANFAILFEQMPYFVDQASSKHGVNTRVDSAMQYGSRPIKHSNATIFGRLVELELMMTNRLAR